MIELFVRKVDSGDVYSSVSLSEESIVSLKYQLNNPDDLSSFTSTYSSSLELPLTRDNSVIFGYPDIVVSDVHAYDYRLLRDSEGVDEGTLVVSSVSDGIISCNLFSNVVDFNSQLTYVDGSTDTVRTLADFISDDNKVYNDSDAQVDANRNIVVEAQYLHKDIKDRLYFTNSDGLCYFMPANIGKPTDFSTSMVYSGPNVLEGETQGTLKDDGYGDMTIFNAPYDDGFQYRTYHLTPVVPMSVIFNNVKHFSSDYTLNIDSNVSDLYSKVGYTLPFLNSLEESIISFKSSDNGYVPSSVSYRSVTVTDAAMPSTGKVIISDFLKKNFTGSDVTSYLPALNNTHVLYYHLTLHDQNSHSYQILVVPEGTAEFSKWYTPFKSAFPTLCSSLDKCVSFEAATNAAIGCDGLNFSSGTWTVTINSYAAVKLAGGGIRVDTTVYDGLRSLEVDKSEYPWHAVVEEYQFGCYLYLYGGAKNTISIPNLLRQVNDPWGIVKKFCKKFNIRLRQDGPKEFTLCFTRDYYSGLSSPTDLTDYLDISTYEVKPYAFESKYLLFKDEPLDSKWLNFYHDTYGEEYGQCRLKTSYPISSTDEWISDGFNYGCSPHEFLAFPYKSKVMVKINDMLQAYDDDENQIDVSGCLVLLYPYSTVKVVIMDNVYDADTLEQGYYDADYLDVHGYHFECCPLSTDTGGYEQFMYGTAKAYPTGNTIYDNMTEYFKDVVDSADSVTVTTNVFLNKLHTDIYTFCHTIYWFDNANWCVSEVNGYDPSSDGPTQVTFLKINDLRNYGKDAYRVDAYGQNCDVTGGGYYFSGETCILTASYPDNYKFDGWLEEGSVVYSSPKYEFEVTSDRELYAVAEVDPNAVTLTVTVDDGKGAVQIYYNGQSQSNPFTCRTGSWVTVKYIPAPGYSFSKWTIAGAQVSTSNPYTFQISSNTTIKAEVTGASGKTVSCSVIPSGGATVSGTGSYSVGDTVTLTATVNSGYTISTPDAWVNFPSHTTSQTSIPYDTITFTMINGNVSGTLNLSTAPTQKYSVYTDSSNIDTIVGRWTEDSETWHENSLTDIPAGATVQITVTPSTGKSLVYESWVWWSGLSTPPASAYSNDFQTVQFTMPSNSVKVNISAYETLSVTFNGDEHVSNIEVTDGTNTWQGTSFSVNCMPYTVLTATVTTANHYSFGGWYDGSSANPRTIAVSTASAQLYRCYTVQAAQYSLIKGTLSNISLNAAYESDDGGTTWTQITFSGSPETASVYSGNSIKLSMNSPATGYKISASSFTPSGGTLTGNDYVFTMPASETTFTCVASPASYNVSGTLAHATIGGSYSYDVDHTYNTRVNLSSTLDSGYQFTSASAWSIVTEGGTVITPTIEAPYTSPYFLMPADDVTFTAAATKVCYNVTPHVTDCSLAVSWVDGSTSGHTWLIPWGATVTITATAPGYEFNASSWSGYPSGTTFSADYSVATIHSMPTNGFDLYCTAYASSWSGLVFTPTGTATIAIENNGTNDPDIEYSSDSGATWTTVTTTAQSFSSAIRVRGTNSSGFSTSSSNYTRLRVLGAPVAVTGSVMSLVDGTGSATSVPAYCFYKLFYTDPYDSSDTRNTITSVPSLPATTLADSCYYYMFTNCRDITSLSSLTLPATVIADRAYYSMFHSCTSITYPPTLPSNVTSVGYSSCVTMFAQCTHLTAAPVFSNAVLHDACYNSMFTGCTSLTTAPSLPSTSLASSCYTYMFQSCSSLTSAPALPATTVPDSAYNGMFQYAGLTSMPAISATSVGDYACRYMFQGCTSLTSVSQLPAMSLGVSCYRSMFQGCTALTTVPSNMLPALVMTSRCYQMMFYKCTSLTISPTLPYFTSLYSNCFNSMFWGCSSLVEIYIGVDQDMSSGTYTSDWCGGDSTTPFSSSGDLYCLSGTSWDTGTSGLPSGWTLHYVD